MIDLLLFTLIKDASVPPEDLYLLALHLSAVVTKRRVFIDFII